VRLASIIARKVLWPSEIAGAGFTTPSRTGKKVERMKKKEKKKGGLRTVLGGARVLFRLLQPLRISRARKQGGGEKKKKKKRKKKKKGKEAQRSSSQ